MWQKALASVVDMAMTETEKSNEPNYQAALKNALDQYVKSIPEGGTNELYRVPYEPLMLELENLVSTWLEDNLKEAITGVARKSVRIFMRGESLNLDENRVMKIRSMTQHIYGDERAPKAHERMSVDVNDELFEERVVTSNPKLIANLEEPLTAKINSTYAIEYDSYINRMELISTEEELKGAEELMSVSVEDVVPEGRHVCEYVEECIHLVFKMLENNILVIARLSNRKAEAVLEFIGKGHRQMQKEEFLRTKAMACDLLGKERGEKAFEHAYNLISKFISFEGIRLDNQCEFKAYIDGIQDTSYGNYFSGNCCNPITPVPELLKAEQWAIRPDVHDVPKEMTIKEYVSNLGTQILSMLEVDVLVTEMDEVNNNTDAWFGLLQHGTITLNPEKFNKIKEMAIHYFEDGNTAFKCVFNNVSGVVRVQNQVSINFDEKTGIYTATRDQFGVSNFEKWVSGADDAQLPHYSQTETGTDQDGEAVKQPLVSITKIPAKAQATTDADGDGDYFNDLLNILNARQ